MEIFLLNRNSESDRMTAFLTRWQAEKRPSLRKAVGMLPP